MRGLIRFPLVPAMAFLVSACWGHSFPDTTTFIQPVREPVSTAEAVHVFVDANGTFYPSGWDDEMGRPRWWKAHSLLQQSMDDPGFRQLIVDGEREQIADLVRFGEERERIFVLVHGFNNSQAQARTAYQGIEQRLNAGPSDGIVRFYWDGLIARGIGAGKIWFNATGYSQLAGSRGLRRVLESFSNKEIYLISHSRGASVILSAFGNPVYDPGFLAQSTEIASRWGADYADFARPAPLATNANTFHILALAPAVDRIDFCDASEQRATRGPFYCPKLRDLAAISSFRYTVNPQDPVLNKFVGLSGNFNPTGLGTDTAVGRELENPVELFQAYHMTPGNAFHAFGHYVESEVFVKMLGDAGLLGFEGATAVP